MSLKQEQDMNQWVARTVSFLAVIMLISSCKSAGTTPPSVQQQETAPPSVLQQETASPTPNETSTLPKSDELINAALENGEIEPETALIYKVYAQFSDARLPSIYQGSADLHTDSHIIDEVQAQFSTLSADTQATLIPFLVPPVYKGSWANPGLSQAPQSAMIIPTGTASGNGQGQDSGNQEGQTSQIEFSLLCDEIDTDQWDSTTGMHSPIRFWWMKSRPEDAATANSFLAAIDNDIWPKLTALMERTPKEDSIAICNGGNADFDVYITPQVARSYAAAYFPPGCKNTPSYIVLNPAVSDGILAHEFMHAIQWSYETSASCMYPGNYAWLAEATASWSQNYVYPTTNEEHGYVPWFYDGGTGGMPPSLDFRNDSHEYGAHLFFFFLTNHFEQPEIVKAAWNNTTSMKSLDAVDNAIPGGFDAVWSDFAIENVVEPPYDEYQVWDQLNQKPSGSSLIKGETSPNNTYKVADKINYLSIKYNWFTFSEDSRLVTFFNGMTYNLDVEPINTYMGTLPIKDGTTQYKFTALPPEDNDGVKIQAYFKVAGDTDWQKEDWTDKPYVSFCRDASSERLTDLIIITSSSNKESNISKSGTYGSLLQVSDVGCYRYGGSASLRFTGTGEGGSFIDEQTLPNVTFERTDAHPNIPYPYLHFKVAEGQLDRTYNYQGEDCTGNGDTHNALSPGSSDNFGNDLYILYGAVNGSSVRRYSGEANANQSMTVNFQCKNGSNSSPNPTMPWFYVDMLSRELEKVYTVQTGGTLDGADDLLQSTDNSTMKFKWHFETLPESGSSEGSTSGSSASDGGTGGQSSSSGSDSSVPQSPASAGFPDVPNYPNVESSAIQSGSGMLALITSDSQEDVAKFYREQLTAQGWTDTSNPANSTGDVIMLMFAKDTKMITLMIAPLDEKTQIMIYEAGQ
jgi:hypothetical protein